MNKINKPGETLISFQTFKIIHIYIVYIYKLFDIVSIVSCLLDMFPSPVKKIQLKSKVKKQFNLDIVLKKSKSLVKTSLIFTFK